MLVNSIVAMVVKSWCVVVKPAMFGGMRTDRPGCYGKPGVVKQQRSKPDEALGRRRILRHKNKKKKERRATRGQHATHSKTQKRRRRQQPNQKRRLLWEGCKENRRTRVASRTKASFNLLIVQAGLVLPHPQLFVLSTRPCASQLVFGFVLTLGLSAAFVLSAAP